MEAQRTGDVVWELLILAQSRAARGFDSDGIADLTKAIELDYKDSDTFHQRGLIYYKQVDTVE